MYELCRAAALAVPPVRRTRWWHTIAPPLRLQTGPFYSAFLPPLCLFSLSPCLSYTQLPSAFSFSSLSSSYSVPFSIFFFSSALYRSLSFLLSVSIPLCVCPLITSVVGRHSSVHSVVPLSASTYSQCLLQFVQPRLSLYCCVRLCVVMCCVIPSRQTVCSGAPSPLTRRPPPSLAFFSPGSRPPPGSVSLTADWRTVCYCVGPDRLFVTWWVRRGPGGHAAGGRRPTSAIDQRGRLWARRLRRPRPPSAVRCPPPQPAATSV